MKKSLLSLLLLVSASAIADTRSAQLLARMGAAFKDWSSYSVEFSLEGIEGRYVVSGRQYYLQVDQTEIYCDGRTRREVNGADREVVVDGVDPADRSILSNPTQVFDFPDEAFTHRFGGASDGNQVVLLTPKNQGATTLVRLEVSAATGLPRSIAYSMDEAGEAIIITIRAIHPDATLPVFDATKYMGYEVIDFR